jgi:hypothetical protein
MAVQKLLVIGENNQPAQYSPIVVSAGVIDAGKPVATGPDGQIDNSLLPIIEELSFTAKEAIAAGAFVNIVNVSGTAELQNANATDATKPAVAWVSESLGMGDVGNASFSGINPFVPIGAFTAENIGEEVFLSLVSGGVVIRSTSFSAGNLIQKLGVIISVNVLESTMSVDFKPEIRAIA